MKRVLLLLCLAATAVLSAESSALADDSELQATLARLNCVPAKIAVTEVSGAIAVYTVTCKGSRKEIDVLCLSNACQTQPRLRPDDDR